MKRSIVLHLMEKRALINPVVFSLGLLSWIVLIVGYVMKFFPESACFWSAALACLALGVMYAYRTAHDLRPHTERASTRGVAVSLFSYGSLLAVLVLTKMERPWPVLWLVSLWGTAVVLLLARVPRKYGWIALLLLFLSWVPLVLGMAINGPGFSMRSTLIGWVLALGAYCFTLADVASLVSRSPKGLEYVRALRLVGPALFLSAGVGMFFVSTFSWWLFALVACVAYPVVRVIWSPLGSAFFSSTKTV